MVSTETRDGETVHRCEACGFHYRDRELAERCEQYCQEHQSCSDEITAQSVERSGQEQQPGDTK